MQALRLLLSLILFALLLSTGGQLLFAAEKPEKTPPGLSSKKSAKKPVAVSGTLEPEACAVYIFYSPECPICAEYFPTIERLHAKFSKFAEFYFVVCDLKSASKLKNEYKTSCRIIEDNSGRLQTELNATVTPQVFLLNQGRVIYSGRIDDRYHSIGNRRSVIRSFDLENVLAALARGEKVQARSAAAVGCFLEKPSCNKR